MSFFDSYRDLFALILPFFAFILPFYFPFSNFLSPFFLFLSPFFLFLSPFFLFLLHFPFFFSLGLFIFFPPNDIGWYSSPRGGGYFPIYRPLLSQILETTVHIICALSPEFKLTRLFGTAFLKKIAAIVFFLVNKLVSMQVHLTNAFFNTDRKN